VFLTTNPSLPCHTQTFAVKVAISVFAETLENQKLTYFIRTVEVINSLICIFAFSVLVFVSKLHASRPQKNRAMLHQK
jgi:hypothetical protein